MYACMSLCMQNAVKYSFPNFSLMGSFSLIQASNYIRSWTKVSSLDTVILSLIKKKLHGHLELIVGLSTLLFPLSWFLSIISLFGEQQWILFAQSSCTPCPGLNVGAFHFPLKVPRLSSLLLTFQLYIQSFFLGFLH